jgi:hypothetical protein
VTDRITRVARATGQETAGKGRRRQARAGDSRQGQEIAGMSRRRQARAGDSRHEQKTAGKRAHRRGSHVSLTLALSDYKDSWIELTNEQSLPDLTCGAAVCVAVSTLFPPCAPAAVSLGCSFIYAAMGPSIPCAVGVLHLALSEESPLILGQPVLIHPQ